MPQIRAIRTTAPSASRMLEREYADVMCGASCVLKTRLAVRERAV
jgi:hypothetical protein